MKKNNIDNDFLYNIKVNNIIEIKKTLNSKPFIINPSSESLICAIKNGNIEILSLFINSEYYQDLLNNNNQTFLMEIAVRGNYIDVVQLLLPYFSFNRYSCPFIYIAYTQGYNDIVELLWKNKEVRDSLSISHPTTYSFLSKHFIQLKLTDFS
jgi:hypothetical protein